MIKIKKQSKRSKIVTAAWELFYKKGFDDTTVDEIIEASRTSKGTFYHYFSSKAALLSSLSYLFDDKYEELLQEMDPNMNSFDKLLYMNKELFFMIENTVSLDILASMYSSQLITKDERHLLDESRVYYCILNDIIAEGQRRKQITTKLSKAEIAKLYAMCERALLYDWCICKGEYSLSNYSEMVLSMFLKDLKL